MKLKFKVYTDGSIRNNTNMRNTDVKTVGAYGYIALFNNEEIKRFANFVENTTISEMELSAIQHGIQDIFKHANQICPVGSVEKREIVIEVYSDSKMCTQAFNEYIPKWAKKAQFNKGIWQSTNGEPVVHQERYKDILASIAKYDAKVKFIHVKAHDDSVMNNEVDKITSDLTKQYLTA